MEAGETNLASNYRPISILCNLSKLCEEVIHKRLMNYPDKFEILPENQFGSRKKKYSFQAATSLFKQIEANWRSKVKTDCVFVDLGKTFDAVNQSVSLKKMNHVGLRCFSHKYTLLKWITSSVVFKI